MKLGIDWALRPTASSPAGPSEKSRRPASCTGPSRSARPRLRGNSVSGGLRLDLHGFLTRDELGHLADDLAPVVVGDRVLAVGLQKPVYI